VKESKLGQASCDHLQTIYRAIACLPSSKKYLGEQRVEVVSAMASTASSMAEKPESPAVGQWTLLDKRGKAMIE
jgi:hypothetical protein